MQCGVKGLVTNITGRGGATKWEHVNFYPYPKGGRTFFSHAEGGWAEKVL